MASSPIKLDVLANVRPLQAETKKAADAVDELGEAVDDAMRDGAGAGDKLERKFADLARAGRRASDDIGDDFRRGFKRAEAGADEFRDEANSTMRETAASIRDVESGLDAVQEIAANAFVGFGPVGAGAGLVTALGLGLVTEELRSQQEEADELKARLTSAYIAAAEEGRNYLSVQQIIEESAAIYQDAERLKQATKDAAELNLDRALVVQAMAGDEEALNAVIAAGADKLEDAEQASRRRAEAGQDVFNIEALSGSQLEALIAKYETQLGVQREGKAAAEEYLGVVEAQNERQAAGNAAAQRAVDERGAALKRYADAAAAIPDPVLTPRLDTSSADGELSRFIAKPRNPIELSIFYKDTSGRRLFGG